MFQCLSHSPGASVTQSGSVQAPPLACDDEELDEELLDEEELLEDEELDETGCEVLWDEKTGWELPPSEEKTGCEFPPSEEKTGWELPPSEEKTGWELPPSDEKTGWELPPSEETSTAEETTGVLPCPVLTTPSDSWVWRSSRVHQSVPPTPRASHSVMERSPA